jgi:hypothetical protein
MAVSIADQCSAKGGCTVVTGGVSAQYNYGDILPVASTAADLANRQTLRGCGLLRAVTNCTAVGDFTTAATAAANQQAANESASTGTTLAKPVMSAPGSLPVVANY